MTVKARLNSTAASTDLNATQSAKSAAKAEEVAAKPATQAKGDHAAAKGSAKGQKAAAATIGNAPNNSVPEPGDTIIRGKIATMDDKHTVKTGAVVISNGIIKAILPADYPTPKGVKNVETKGIIFPGLMNLHNHMAYNFLPIYDTKGKDYGNRDQWPTGKDYEHFVNNPKNLVTDPALFASQAEALKYAEIMQIAGGTTAVQGTPQDAAISTSLVRNVELKNADISVEDKVGQGVIGMDKNAKPDKVKETKAQWEKLDTYFYHLSEGKDEHALEDYYTLKKFGLITKSFVGIHSAALGEKEFKDWAKTTGEGPKVVWSPLSNLMLYGQTTDVVTAMKYGATIALGTDWTPSGSKNLLWELKVAQEYNKEHLKGKLTTQQLVDMVTKNPAKLLNWQDKVGQVKPGMIADLLVIDDTGGDPYQALINSTETNVKLVMVAGDPLYGDQDMMKALKKDKPLEKITELKGRTKLLDLQQPDQPKGKQSIEDIVHVLNDSEQYSAAKLAKKLNTPGKDPKDPFHNKKAMLAWLQGRYEKDGTKIPANFKNPAADITTAQVADYLKRKYPNAAPLPGVIKLFQNNDDAYWTALAMNSHLTGDNKVLDLKPIEKFRTKG